MQLERGKLLGKGDHALQGLALEMRHTTSAHPIRSRTCCSYQKEALTLFGAWWKYFPGSSASHKVSNSSLAAADGLSLLGGSEV
jgi:hypothetical protein